jgi:hypothetical protein
MKQNYDIVSCVTKFIMFIINTSIFVLYIAYGKNK